jgi:hypothetical protein
LWAYFPEIRTGILSASRTIAALTIIAVVYILLGMCLILDSSLPDTGQEKMMTGYRIITRYSHTIFL